MNILINPENQLVAVLVQYGEEVADKVFASVTPEMITNQLNREIFSKCLALHQDGREVSLMDFKDEVEAVVRITEAITSFGFFDDIKLFPIVESVQDDYRRSVLKRLGADILSVAADKSFRADDALKIIEEYRSTFDVSSFNAFKSLAEIVDECGNREAYEEMSISCFKTGWRGFDEGVVIKPGDLVILAGRPSMGKTDWVLQFCKAIGQHNHPSAIFSLETDRKYLNKRLAGGRTIEKYLQGCERNVRLPIFIDDTPIQSIYTARSQVRYAQKHFGIEAAVFDYLTIMDTPKAESRTREVEELVKGLKQNARETGVPHIVLAQLNRSVEARNNKRPMLSDLRDSGGIEQVADIIMFAYRPIYYGIEECDGVNDTTNYLEIISGKQREGARGAIKFFYDPIQKQVSDWAEEDRYEYEKCIGNNSF